MKKNLNDLTLSRYVDTDTNNRIEALLATGRSQDAQRSLANWGTDELEEVRNLLGLLGAVVEEELFDRYRQTPTDFAQEA